MSANCGRPKCERCSTPMWELSKDGTHYFECPNCHHIQSKPEGLDTRVRYVGGPWFDGRGGGWGTKVDDSGRTHP